MVEVERGEKRPYQAAVITLSDKALRDCAKTKAVRSSLNGWKGKAMTSSKRFSFPMDGTNWSNICADWQTSVKSISF